MQRKLNLLGQKFGRLNVLSEDGRDRGGYVMWLCRCDCGTVKRIRSTALTQGGTVSCGCYGREQTTIRSRGRPTTWKHGLIKTRGWRSWSAMNRRVRCTTAWQYRYYGGRGITICERWSGKDGFLNFLADMGERPEGKTLDRKDNDGNYEPANCRWATAQEQSANRRRHVVSV